MIIQLTLLTNYPGVLPAQNEYYALFLIKSWRYCYKYQLFIVYYSFYSEYIHFLFISWPPGGEFRLGRGGGLPLQLPAKAKKDNPGVGLPKVKNLIYRIWMREGGSLRGRECGFRVWVGKTGEAKVFTPRKGQKRLTDSTDSETDSKT